MQPQRLTPTDNPAPVLALIRAAFAGMEGRVDPPSSARDLTEDSVRAQAAQGEVWRIGKDPVLACVFLTVRPGALYLGKLATAEAARGQGLARRLVDHAAARARALDLPLLELRVRVELVENHAAFAAMGFVQTGATAHPGYDRPTSFTFQRKV